MIQGQKDVFRYFLESTVNDINWYVEQRDSTDKLFHDLARYIERHDIACKKISDMSPMVELDSHKQAAVICAACLDLYPLQHRKYNTKAALYWHPNEFIALQFAQYHVRRCLKYHFTQYGIFPQDIAILDSASILFPDLQFDEKSYTSNFLFLLRQEKILNHCPMYADKPSGFVEYCKENCILYDRCSTGTKYSYLALSKLFYHYDLMLMAQIRKERKANDLPPPPPSLRESAVISYVNEN